MMLNLGAGVKKKEGFVNIDKSPTFSPDVLLDIGKERFPFNDNTVEYIVASHIFEHLTYEELVFCLNECYRVLKPDGILEFAVPSYTSMGMFVDPSHKTFWTERTIAYFIKYPKGYINNPDYSIDPNVVTCDWEIIEKKVGENIWMKLKAVNGAEKK